MPPRAAGTRVGTCINETILKTTISESKAAKIVDVCGYRRYSILARFEGPPDATFKVEVNNNSYLVAQEFLQLNAAGWLNFFKEYTVFGPKIGVVVYHPPAAGLKVDMTLYAGL
jgi:hypothetical protein